MIATLQHHAKFRERYSLVSIPYFSMSAVTSILESVSEQRELFLWKFPEVPRNECNELMKVPLSLSSQLISSFAIDIRNSSLEIQLNEEK